MKRSTIVLTTLLLTVTPHLMKCVDAPSNPSEEPKNASLNFFFPNEDFTADEGIIKQIGLEVEFPVHIKSPLSLRSSCGDIDSSVSFNSDEFKDTLLLDLVFSSEGLCTLTVSGEMVDDELKGKTDSIIVHVLAGTPTLSFSTTPAAFTTHTGKSDTLRFAVNSSQNTAVAYALSCDPDLDSAEMYLLDTSDDDSAFVYFNPQQPGVYTVTLTATAGDLSTDASVPVTVLASLSPTEVDNPQTIITGVPDTLVYTLTPEQVADGVTMGLLDPENLPADIATVIPSGADSILIAVNSAQEGELSFSITTTNGTLTDTATYTFTFVDQSNAVWKTTSATIDAVEGERCSVELTPYLFDGIFVEAISPTATLGSFNDSGAWYYTPPWGSETTLSVTISGKRGGDVSQDFSLTVNIASGDETAPEITLFSPATESKTFSSSEASVSVIVKDAEAGVDKVTFATASATVDGTADNDSTWSAVITGLPAGTATDVVITATDKSMKNNSSSKTITLTCDPSVEDAEAPVITQTSGPESGNRITSASGTFAFTITDGSGVDSVWWTLNDVFVAAVAAADDGYTVSYDLTDFGENVIKLYAKDGSNTGNEGSKTITLNYNTAVTAITPSGPQNGATEVSLTPQFTWTGGTDEDGDSVFYRVEYGTSATDLSQTTAILISNIVTLGSGQELQPTTPYYWRVVAWSKAFPDTVESDIVSFTTLDPTADDITGPRIAQTAGPEDNARVTAAAGTITVSVTDPNGVASVSVSLNSGAAQPLTAGANNTYAYEFTLPSYGANTITFNAVDGSANNNSSEETITLNYNTEPTAITLTDPAANATDVSTTPTFEWTGGEDPDGDNVTVTVNYGTSQGQLTNNASVTGTTATISGDLEYNTAYYWQVTATSASTAFPDTVQSEVGAFTTGGSLPTISVHPVNQTIEEEQSVTFSVTASANGFGELSYQWRKNGTIDVGTNSSSYTIEAVTIDMNNNTYDCVVTNDVGSVTSNAATLTVTEIETHTVAFDMNDGLPQEPEQTVAHGDVATPPTTEPTRDGYRFTGWFPSNTSTMEFDFSETPIIADRTIYAKWEQVFKVTYDRNNATSGSVPTDGNSYTNGQTVTVKTNSGNLVRTGYTFNGWNTSSSGTGAHRSEGSQFTIGSDDVLLYAEWEPIIVTYIVIFDGQGADKQANPNQINVVSPSTSVGSLPEAPEKNAYVFDGWFTGANGTGSRFSGSTTVTKDLKVYANWVIKDICGNYYTEVQIGNQIWMVENLQTTRYNDGDSIPNITDDIEWSELSYGAFCWYDNYSSYKKKMGALYNFHAVESNKLAPQGWHVATDEEWTVLEDYLISQGYNWDNTTTENKIGKSLSVTSGWQIPSSAGSGEEGEVGFEQSQNNKAMFSAQPAGTRLSDMMYDGVFSKIYEMAMWWAPVQGGSSEKIPYRIILSYGTNLGNGYSGYSVKSKTQGKSVRCIRDY